MIPPQNVSEAVYRREVERRTGWCRQLLEASLTPLHLLRIVVLSCKRPQEFARLMESLRPIAPHEVAFCAPLLVDNGSGNEVRRIADRSKFFSHTIFHEANIGMGGAINNALERHPAEFILFIEDDLVYTGQETKEKPFWIQECLDIFREFPGIGLIKLKRKDGWDEKPYRRIGPMQTTTTGVRFHPWLPSPRWSFGWGQRPWYPVGVHNVWSLGPVMFRWVAWKEAGSIPSGQGRGQAVAAEEVYARRFNRRWLAARPVDFAPFSQPTTPESPGFGDRV